MSFEEFLKNKKIDENLFKKNEQERWFAWKALFEQMHPESFTAQKLFLINQIRRKDPFKPAETSSDKNESTAATAKPKPKT